jgi:hypothetical protein
MTHSKKQAFLKAGQVNRSVVDAAMTAEATPAPTPTALPEALPEAAPIKTGRKRKIDNNVPMARLVGQIPESILIDIKIFCLKHNINQAEFIERAVMHQYRHMKEHNEIF